MQTNRDQLSYTLGMKVQTRATVPQQPPSAHAATRRLKGQVSTAPALAPWCSDQSIPQSHRHEQRRGDQHVTHAQQLSALSRKSPDPPQRGWSLEVAHGVTKGQTQGAILKAAG